MMESKTNPEWIYKLIELMEEGSEAYSEQVKIFNAVIDTVKTKNTIRAIQGPTGLGKTYSYLASALFFVKEGKKTLIAVPTYSQLNAIPKKTLKKAKDVHFLNSDFKFHILKGKSKLGNSSCKEEEEESKILRGFITGIEKSKMFKLEKYKDCSIENGDCQFHERLKSYYITVYDADIVLTVHAKLIASPWLEKLFDVIIIDESHSFETSLHSRGSNLVNLDKLLNLLGKENSIKLDKQVKRIQKDKSKGKNSNPGTLKRFEMVLLNYYTEGKGSQALRKVLTSFNNSQKNQNIMSRTGNMIGYKSFDKKVVNWKGKSSVLLISATIDEPEEHISRCFFTSKLILNAIQFREPGSLKSRFEKRPIFAIYDGPNLAKLENDKKIYEEQRNKANNIIIKGIMAVCGEVTLVLCRNGEDAENINSLLKANEMTKSKVLDLEKLEKALPDEDSNEPIDLLEAVITKEIEKGKKIIIASASSKLWEGANIQDLKFLIIDALPYPSIKTKRVGPWIKSPVFRIMKNKLQQGIGRLTRKDDQYGICLIIDRRFYDQKKILEKSLPGYIMGGQICSYIREGEIDEQLKKRHSMLKIGKNPRFYENVGDYFNEDKDTQV